MELLSLTSNKDLVLARLDDYYFCLAEPRKRKPDLNWYKAINYCEVRRKGYSLPNKYELDLIYTNKGNLSLVEACLYGEAAGTFDLVCSYWPWVWSSDHLRGCWESSYAHGLFFNDNENPIERHKESCGWTLPIRRIKC